MAMPSDCWGCEMAAHSPALPYIRLAHLCVEAIQLEAFKQAARTLGQAAVQLEAGCLALYAVADQENPCRITVFEVYRDEAAYQAHLNSAHFASFQQQTRDMILTRQLSTVTPISLIHQPLLFNSLIEQM